MLLTTHNQGALLQLGNMHMVLVKGTPFYFIVPGLGAISDYSYQANLSIKTMKHFGIPLDSHSVITGGEPFDTLIHFCITQAFERKEIAAHNNKAKLGNMLNNHKYGSAIFRPSTTFDIEGLL